MEIRSRPSASAKRTNVANTGSAFASARSIAWGYDSLGQVTKADSSVSGFDRAYQYDGIGNRKKAANSLTLPTADNYNSNALNQYTAVGTIIPTYDDDGNATAYPVPTRLTANSTLAWDAENRMKSANVNGVTTTYLYDAGSRRIAQTTGTTTTVYVYDGWNPVAEYTGTTLKKTYTWGSDISGGLQGAGGVGGLLAVTDEAATDTPSYFPTFDGNGNVSEYLYRTGTVAAHYEYDPFGRSTTSTGTLAPTFAHRFSTKPIDYPTGLYYYGYRFYDPVTGRWPSRDPIEEEGGSNQYGFVANNGVGLWDRIGLAYDTHLTKKEAESLKCALLSWLPYAYLGTFWFGSLEIIGRREYSVMFMQHYLKSDPTPYTVPTEMLKADSGIKLADEQALKFFKTSNASTHDSRVIHTAGDLSQFVGRTTARYTVSSEYFLTAELTNERYAFLDTKNHFNTTLPKLTLISKIMSNNGCCWGGGDVISDYWMGDLETYGLAKSFDTYGSWTVYRK